MTHSDDTLRTFGFVEVPLTPERLPVGLPDRANLFGFDPSNLHAFGE